MSDETYNVNDPNFIKNLTDIATAQTAPSLALGNQSLDQQGVQLDNSANQVNQNYDTVGQNLLNQAKNSQGTLEEKYNNLGLLRSGMNAAGLGDIQTNLTKNQALNEQDKANKLADIAIQRAGLGTQRAQLQITGQSSINDLVTKLLNGAQTSASTTPQGQTTYIPGVGYVQGTQAPKYDTIDLGGSVAVVDSQGNVVNSYAKGLTPSASSSSSSSSSSASKAATTKLNQLNSSLSTAIKSGAKYLNGTQTREDLIRSLVNQYGDIVSPVEIAQKVYQNIRGNGEAAFNGLTQDQIDALNNGTF